MVRTPSVDKNGLKKGVWSEEEDNKLRAYVLRYGHWNWRQLPKFAGLSRCGKSCRLRWFNYLKPGVRRGNYTAEEEDLIIKLHEQYGNRWSAIAAKLPGRTDNDIKNHWHTHFRKRNKQNRNAEQSQQMDDRDQNEQSSSKSSSESTDQMREREYSNDIAAVDSLNAFLDVSSLSCGSSSVFDGCVEWAADSGNCAVESVNESFESFWTEAFDLDTSLNNHSSTSPWLEEDLMYPFSSFLDDTIGWLPS